MWVLHAGKVPKLSKRLHSKVWQTVDKSYLSQTGNFSVKPWRHNPSQEAESNYLPFKVSVFSWTDTQSQKLAYFIGLYVNGLHHDYIHI